MANIKHTKNELKAQREGLKRFQRYLPTLQLKKQQLQLEVRQLEAKLESERQAAARDQAELAKWVSLFAEPMEWEDWLAVRAIRLGWLPFLNRWPVTPPSSRQPRSACRTR